MPANSRKIKSLYHAEVCHDTIQGTDGKLMVPLSKGVKKQ